MSIEAYQWISTMTVALGMMMRRGGNDFLAINAFLEVNRLTMEAII